MDERELCPFAFVRLQSSRSVKGGGGGIETERSDHITGEEYGGAIGGGRIG